VASISVETKSTDDLLPLIQASQARLGIEQVRRIPPAHFLVDLCVAWTAYKAGVGASAWIWFVVMTIAQTGRTIHLVQLDRSGKLSAARMLRYLTVWLTVLGALHAVIMAMVFSQPPSNVRYVLTMILVGNAAGAVSPAAGHLASYIWWEVVYGGTLVTCWLLQGSLEGLAIATLLAALFVILTFYVRDQGRSQAELVALTDSLRRERDRAERASQAKTRFFSAASHDLRQPLTALSYNAATVCALAEVQQDETLAKVGQGISRALEESRSLLDSLLEVSELDAGAVRVGWETVEVTALLREVVEQSASVARERGLELRLEHARMSPCMAWADVVLLRRIVQNLVGNALKFTASGTVLLGCRYLGDGPDGGVEIAVADTGRGIPPEAQDQVFEEFFQVGNAERDRSRGLGLGLAIVSRLVRLLEGSISLSSVPGEGSTFRVALKRAASAKVRAEPDPASTSRPVNLIRANGRRVLVVDDEREIRESLSTFMGTLGWSVRAVSDSDAAIEAWDSGFEAEVLVVDFRLRDGSSGLEVLARLRERGCAAPCVMITGDTEPGRITAARAVGIRVMYKPVDGFVLANTLAKLLDHDPAQGVGTGA
jgi:two-component system, sensor histidine kinase